MHLSYGRWLEVPFLCTSFPFVVGATEHTFLEVIVSVLLSAARLELQWLPSSTGSWTKPQNSTGRPQWSQSTTFSLQPAPSLQVSPGFHGRWDHPATSTRLSQTPRRNEAALGAHVPGLQPVSNFLHGPLLCENAPQCTLLPEAAQSCFDDSH